MMRARQAALYAALGLALGLVAYFPGDFEVSSKLLLPQLPITPGYNITVGLGLPPEIYAYFNPRQPSELYLSLGLSERLRWAVAREMAATRAPDDAGRARESRRIAGRLKHAVRVNALRGGLLEFTVRGHRPEEIRWIARLYAAKFADNLSNIQKSTILKKRRAIERRMAEINQENAQIQAEFKAFRTEKGVVAPGEQLGVGISIYGSLKASLIARRARMQALRIGSTPDNPDVKRLQGEVASLQAQMDTMENSERRGILSLHEVSRQSTDYTALLLRQQHLETLREAFARALQVAIFEEAATDANSNLVDENEGDPDRNLRLWPAALALAALAALHRRRLAGLLRQLQG